MTFGVFDKAFERSEATRTTDQAAVQTDREHLRRFGTFGVKHVERVFEVFEEVVTLVETLHLGEAHVVGVEGVRDHQMRLAGRVVRFPIRQVIVVGVAVVEETTFFHDQATGVRASAAGVPAQWALAGDFGEDADRFEHVLALLRFVHVLIVDPAVAMAADLVAGIDHCADHVRVALGGHGHGEDGQRNVEFLEQFQNPPDPGAAAILVKRFHAHVTRALQRLSGHHLGEEGFGLFIAVQNVALAAFFVIEYERQSDAGIARPVWVRRVTAVTDQVAWVVSAHCSLPSYSLTDGCGGLAGWRHSDGLIVYNFIRNL
ncbi:hypothetical protein D3C73_125920 [compost metagenome]